jgi:hypothetical protein
MGRHRLEPTRVRPRYGRVAAAALSLVVTMVALLGGLGILPIESSRSPADQASDASGTHAGVTASASGADASGSSSAASSADAARSAQPDALPADSGDGRRVVFSEGSQRVWLVDADGAVTSTYLVSGSVTDNLQPGRYHVYSRSRWAVGVEDSGVMQYFVRFAHGPNAAIGFHSIPTRSGTPLQTEAQLGTPQSHGCIRQKLSDAQRMWDFADVGTDVVVVA